MEESAISSFLESSPRAPLIAASKEEAKAPADPGARYINRELSWLEFNQRVLDQAFDASHPLLERVKFLAITATNLDEFFMIRVSTTQKNLRHGIEDVAPDGYNTQEQLAAMHSRAVQMLHDLGRCWDQLRPLLSAEHIVLLEPGDWPETRAVRGSNRCDLAVTTMHGGRTLLATAAIDNLVKGAAGQAIQNLNLMLGWPEDWGLPFHGTPW